MLKRIWKGEETSGLIRDALEEVYVMLEREESMFRAVCDLLFLGKELTVDILVEDEDINMGERMVRRMVFEHLALNPKRDLPASVSLISVVHDVERIGDYTKSLLELVKWRSDSAAEEKHCPKCSEIRGKIEPLFGITLKAFREGDSELAREVMRRHREIKTQTDVYVESMMRDPDVGREGIVFSFASRFLRRISAHLSNISSSIANPFDRIGKDDEP